MEENAAWNAHGDFMTPNNTGALPVRLQNDGNNLALRFGPPATEIGLGPQFLSANPPAFGGTKAHINPAMIQTHPSSRQFQAPLNELRWYLDTRVLSTELGGVVQRLSKHGDASTGVVRRIDVYLRCHESVWIRYKACAAGGVGGK